MIRLAFALAAVFGLGVYVGLNLANNPPAGVPQAPPNVALVDIDQPIPYKLAPWSDRVSPDGTTYVSFRGRFLPLPNPRPLRP